MKALKAPKTQTEMKEIKRNLGYCLVFLITFLVGNTYAQTQVLVYLDEADPIHKTAQQALSNVGNTHELDFTFSSLPTDFTTANLQHFEVVVFLNRSVQDLDYRQSAALEQFVKAGGGFVGVHAAAQDQYRWLWFGNLLNGKLATTQADAPFSLSLITNLPLGGITVSPYWKITDKALIFSTLPVECKPVLLDLSSKTWAWYYKTTYGGSVFYTALGGTSEAYQSADFINHLVAGIRGVRPKEALNLEQLKASNLPAESDFSKEIILNNLPAIKTFTVLPNKQLLLAAADGTIYLYNGYFRSLKSIGFLPQWQNIKALKPDPEFNSNGYVYGFLDDENSGGSIINRMVIEGDTLGYLSDFTSTSASPVQREIRYQTALFEQSPFSFPAYYDNKRFRIDDSNRFQVETRQPLTDELLNIEPFLPSWNIANLQAISLDSDGSLLYLADNQLVKVSYTAQAQPLRVEAVADVVEGKTPLKVTFTAGQLPSEPVALEWSINDVPFSVEATASYIFKEAGNYIVRLKATTNSNITAEHWLVIRVESNKKKK